MERGGGARETRTRVCRVRKPDWTHGHCLQTYTSAGEERSRAEGRCIPVVCPRDGDEEDGSLEDVLKDDTSPVVLYGVRRNRLGEGDAEDGVEARPDVRDGGGSAG